MKIRRPQLILLGILAIVIISGLFILNRPKKDLSQNSSAYAGDSTAVTNQPTDKQETDFDKTKQSLTDPDSTWVIVNKQRPLPVGYAPNDLVNPKVALRLAAANDEMKVRKETATAMEAMFNAANAAGIKLLLASGYRSEALQKTVYNGYVAQKGQAAADTDSARPGYSEHQTGWAFDIGRIDRKCEIQACFGETPEGKWIAANADKYGFVIRYLPNKQLVTGYVAEPWHLRYVGKDLAKTVKDSGRTLEEFFELPAAPDYN